MICLSRSVLSRRRACRSSAPKPAPHARQIRPLGQAPPPALAQHQAGGAHGLDRSLVGRGREPVELGMLTAGGIGVPPGAAAHQEVNEARCHRHVVEPQGDGGDVGQRGGRGNRPRGYDSAGTFPRLAPQTAARPRETAKRWVTTMTDENHKCRSEHVSAGQSPDHFTLPR